jgi:hypothetical protein
MARTSPNFIVILLVFAALLYVAALFVAPALASAFGGISFAADAPTVTKWEMPPFEWVDHPELVHGADAIQARNCLTEHGPKAYFIQHPDHGVHFLCSFPGEETIYTIVADLIRGTNGFRQRTGFSKAENLSSARTNLLRRQGGGNYINSSDIKYLYEQLAKKGVK